jgi:hypothetical protein
MISLPWSIHCRGHVFYSQTCCFHSIDYFLVHPDHLSFRPVLHRFGKDEVCIKVDGHHNVAVASLGCVGESTRLVGVDFIVEVHHASEYVIEFVGRERLVRCGFFLDFDPYFLLFN